MADLTYTVVGHFFPNSQKLVIDVAIPKEPVQNSYQIDFYDISKEIFGKIIINTIVCNLKLSSDRFPPTNSSTVKYDFHIDEKIGNMTVYPKTPSIFNYKNNDCLVLFVHDDKFGNDELDILINNIEDYYRNATLYGNYIEDPGYPVTNRGGKPRTIGVSIIRE